MSDLNPEFSEERLARSRTSEQERTFSVLSLVLENRHLDVAERKALRLTCHELRSQVSRRVHTLGVFATVDPDALAASGLLGKQIKSLIVQFDRRAGDRPGEQERWSKLLQCAIASCAESLEALSLWTCRGCEYNMLSYKFPTLHCWALDCLAIASWPELRRIAIPTYDDFGVELSNHFIRSLAILGSPAKFPRLADLCISTNGDREAADDLATGWFMPQLSKLEISVHCDRPGTPTSHGERHDRILSGALGLRSLKLDGNVAGGILEYAKLPQLTKLRLYDRCPSLFARPWPQLRALVLHPDSFSSENFPPNPYGVPMDASAATLFPSLTALSLNDLDDTVVNPINWEAVRHLNLTSLRVLTLSEVYVDKDKAVELAETCNALLNLRVLDVTFNGCARDHSFDNAHLKGVLRALLASQCLPQLTVLYLAFDDMDVEDFPLMGEILTRCARLRMLALYIQTACADEDDEREESLQTILLHILMGRGVAGALPLLKELGITIPEAEQEDLQRALRRIWPQLPETLCYHTLRVRDGVSYEGYGAAGNDGVGYAYMD